MSEQVLRSWLIDTVQSTTVNDEEAQEYDIPKVRMVRYSVLAENPEHALHRYFEEEAGVEVEVAEPTDIVVVGISAGPETIATSGR